MMKLLPPPPCSMQSRPWKTDVPWPCLSAILFGTLGMAAGAVILVQRLRGRRPDTMVEGIVQLTLLTTLLAMFALIPPRGKLAEKLGSRRLNRSDIRIVAIGLIMIYAWNIFATGIWENILRYFGLAFETRQELIKECSGASPAQFLMLVLTAGVLTPFVEEVLFRRLIFGLLRPLGAWAALTITALIFAAAHGFLYGLPALFGLGAVFQLQYLYTGNLRTSIATHMAFNIISLTAVFLVGI